VPKGVGDPLYSATSIPGTGANPASCRKGNGYNDRGAKVKTQFHLAPRLRVSAGRTLLPLYALTTRTGQLYRSASLTCHIYCTIFVTVSTGDPHIILCSTGEFRENRLREDPTLLKGSTELHFRVRGEIVRSF
jgi:hypothetical protein